MDVQIETMTGLPDVVRGGGNSAGPYAEAMKALKLPTGKGDQKKYQTFFVLAGVDASITDPTERDKAAKDKCRKLSNSFSGIAKRVIKADPAYKFAFRTMRQNPEDESSPLGVRVYRVEAAAA